MTRCALLLLVICGPLCCEINTATADLVKRTPLSTEGVVNYVLQSHDQTQFILDEEASFTEEPLFYSRPALNFFDSGAGAFAKAEDGNLGAVMSEGAVKGLSPPNNGLHTLGITWKARYDLSTSLGLIYRIDNTEISLRGTGHPERESEIFTSLQVIVSFYDVTGSSHALVHKDVYEKTITGRAEFVSENPWTEEGNFPGESEEVIIVNPGVEPYSESIKWKGDLIEKAVTQIAGLETVEVQYVLQLNSWGNGPAESLARVQFGDPLSTDGLAIFDVPSPSSLTLMTIGLAVVVFWRIAGAYHKATVLGYV